jgi:lipopolysaccharide transport system permease protein
MEPQPPTEPPPAGRPPQEPPSRSDFDAERRWVRRASSAGFVGIEDDAISAPGEAEQLIEQERLHRVIPRVKPLTDEELPVEAPPRQRYRTPVARALKDLWRTREVMFTFVERDLRVRYKQAALGAFWAIVQPIMLMVIFTVVFGKIAKVGSEGLPYPVFSYAALVPWSLFTSSITYATGSIVGNSAIIRKIYMPREILSLFGILSSGFDYVISLAIMFGMLAYYHFSGSQCGACLPGRVWLAFPLLLGVMLMLTIAASLVAGAITVYFRDTRYGIPLILQIALYGTPVAYPLSKMIGPGGVLHGGIAKAYEYLNPMAPIIDGFRRIFGLGQWPQWGPLGAAAVVSFVAMVLAYWWYKRIDRTFADVI